MTVFENNERLSEIEKSGKVKRQLIAGPGSVELYFGLSEKELHPFQDLADLADVYLPAALRQAFPAGPASVGAESVTVQLGATRMTITVSKIAKDRIAFAWRDPNPKSDYEVTGAYIEKALPPLPDNYSIATWDRFDGARLNTLADARRLPARDKKKQR